MPYHLVEKRARLGAQTVVHRFGGVRKRSFAGDGLCIAVREQQRCIVGIQNVKPQTFPLFLLQTQIDRHDMFAYRIAEREQLLVAVIQPNVRDCGVFYVIGKAVRLSERMTFLYKLFEQRSKFVRVRKVCLALCIKGVFAQRAIRGGVQFKEFSAADSLAAQHISERGSLLLVGAFQFCKPYLFRFPLSAQSDVLLQQQTELRPIGSVDLGGVGAVRNGCGKRLSVQSGQFRKYGLKLFLIIRIGRIMIRPCIEQRFNGRSLLVQLAAFADNSLNVLKVLCPGQLFAKHMIALLKSVDVGTTIGDFGEFPVGLHGDPFFRDSLRITLCIVLQEHTAWQAGRRARALSLPQCTNERARSNTRHGLSSRKGHEP